MASYSHRPLPQGEGESPRRGRICLAPLTLLLLGVLLYATRGPETSEVTAWIQEWGGRLRDRLRPRRGWHPPKLHATGECKNGKFKNDPRIRKEWRQLDADELRAVQDAFWHLKGFERVASGGNKAGYAPSALWATTEAGIARCKFLNENEAAEDQNTYCDYFTNYDEIAALHACSVKDPRCDQGHTGPHFMNFHRMVILKLELALLAADANRPMKVKAIPYWDQSLDSSADPVGIYFNDDEKFIYTNNYFGDFWTKAEDEYAVVNGLFAEWPVAQWTEERFGATSNLNKSKCIASQFFTGTVATTSDCPNYTKDIRWFRDHVDCSQYVTRQPDDPDGPQAVQPLGGSYGIVYSKEEFEACGKYPENVRTWMQWNTCQDPGLFFCDIPKELLLLPQARNRLRDTTVPALKEDIKKAIQELEVAAAGGPAPSLPLAQGPTDADSVKARLVKAQVIAGLIWSLSVGLESDNVTDFIFDELQKICEDPMVYGYYTDQISRQRQFPRMQHGQAHFKSGRDFLDVTTSANDCGQFTQHADEDRSNMNFVLNSLKQDASLEDNYWHYPATQQDVFSNGLPPYGLSGPFTIAGLLTCNTDFDTFPFYRWTAGAWTPGTLLDDVVNSGFPFTDLFNRSCAADQDCSGRSRGGYTNREIMFYTHPSRTPYTYDTLAENFDPTCQLWDCD